MSVVAEIALFPLGTDNPSISRVVADSIKVIEQHGLKYEITPTGTNVEGELGNILDTVRDMNEVPFSEGANRVILLLRLDDRRDRSISLEYEQQSVEEKL